jgi:predicted transglutaminase-like cysteine proteinase
MALSRWRVIATSAVFAFLCLGLSAVLSPASAALDRSDSYVARSLPALKPFATVPDLGPDKTAPEPFGMATTGVTSGGLIRKWHDVRAGLANEYRTLSECRQDPTSCAAAPTRFLTLIEKARNLVGRARITEINRAVNLAIRPMTDLAQYGQVELWATPLMTFKSGAGDCEDYAIAKYAALIQLGVPSDDLRLLVVYDHDARENHAVMAVRLEQRWLILDNRTMDIKEDAKAATLSPLFILRDQWVRRVDAGSKPQPVKDQGQVSRFGISDLPESLSIRFGLMSPGV